MFARWCSNQFLFRRKRLLIVSLVVAGVLWITGLCDKLRETSFSEFYWPPYGSLVKQQVKEMLGEQEFLGALANDYSNLKVLITPRCDWKTLMDDNEEVRRVLIIVKSFIGNSRARDVIRETWGSPADQRIEEDFEIRTVFVVGRFSSEDEDRRMRPAVDREAEKHGDLLLADIEDTYRNNTAKFLHSLKLAMDPSELCVRPAFLLLLDDDYMLSTHNLVNLLKERSSEGHMYEGFVFHTAPFRMKFHKHAVSLEEYPYNQYPSYVSAGAVLLSQHTLKTFYYATQLVKLYKMDDVYAGILAFLTEVYPAHNEAFVFWSRTITHDEWSRGKVVAAHGYSAQKLLDEYPIVRFLPAG